MELDEIHARSHDDEEIRLEPGRLVSSLELYLFEGTRQRRHYLLSILRSDQRALKIVKRVPRILGQR